MSSHHRHPQDPSVEHDESAARERLDLRDLLRLHPRLLLAAGLMALVMVPVGVFVAALGVWVLEFSGGAARDTSIVVAIAGYAVSDFWGGGLTTTLTRARASQVAVAWGLARMALLAIFVAVFSNLAPVAPIQLALAVPAAYAGARVARKQAALRRQIRREREQGSDEPPGTERDGDPSPPRPRPGALR